MARLYLCVTSLGLICAFAVSAAEMNCAAFPDADQKRVVDYVVKKYQIPEGVRISIKEAVLVSGSCYRKLTFTGSGPLGVFALTQYLSPELRYLSPELLDSTEDPDRVREEKARQTMGELTSGEFPSLGPANAPVTVVIFSDFQCPYCRKAAEMLRNEQLIQRGDGVRLVFRHMPLPQHPWAQEAAQAAACAQFQSSAAFWAMHDQLFTNQPAITNENAAAKMSEFAERIPVLDQKAFQECRTRQMSLGAVLRDREMGAHLGVQGTPSVFVNGEPVDGLGDPDQFHRLLVKRLEERRTSMQGVGAEQR